MKKKQFSRLIDYMPPVIGFIAAVVGVLGAPKWNAHALGLAKITPMGWCVLFIGSMAMLASLAITARKSREQALQSKQRQRIAEIGKAQLLSSVDYVICLFRGDTIWRGKLKPPESPTELLTTERRAVLADLDLNSVSPFKDGTMKDIKWFTMIEDRAIKGRAEIVSCLQIYAAFLSPEIIEATTKLLNCYFLQIRLIHMHDFVDANIRGDVNRRVSFFWVRNDEMHNAEYEEFWMLVSDAMTLCGAKRTASGHPMFMGR